MNRSLSLLPRSALVVAAVLAAYACTSGPGPGNTDEWGRVEQAGIGSPVAAAPLPVGLRGAAALVLADGRAMLVGGETAAGATAATYIYNPRAGTWTNGPNLLSPRCNHTAHRLRSGLVVVVGGDDCKGSTASRTAAVDVWDPVLSPSATSFLSATKPLLTPRAGHTTTYLPGGRLLVVGGASPGTGANAAEVLASDLKTSSVPFSFTAIPGDLNGHAAAAYSNDVYIAGGASSDALNWNSTALTKLSWNATSQSLAATSLTALGTPRPRALGLAFQNGSGAAIGLFAGGSGGPEGGAFSSAFQTDTSAIWTSPVVAMQRLPESAVLMLLANGSAYRYTNGAASAVTTPSGASLGLPARERVSTVLLPGGEYLIAGGYGGGAFLTETSIVRPWTPPASIGAPSPSSLASSPDAVVTKDRRLVVPSAGAVNIWSFTEPSAGFGSATPPQGITIGSVGQASTLLKDGRTLVTCGLVGGVGRVATTVIVDTSSAVPTFVQGPSTAVGGGTDGRAFHTANTLPDGGVLLVGGEIDANAPQSVLLTPVANGSWNVGAFSMSTVRRNHTVTVLADGRALAIGGEDGSGPLNAIEVFTGTGWTKTTATLSTPRTYHSASLMPNGRVLVCGGRSTVNGTFVAHASCEWVDAGTTGASVSVTPAAPLPSGPRFGHAAVLLPTGHLMLVGGSSGTGALQSTEIFYPSLDQWMPGPQLGSWRNRPAAVVLPEHGGSGSRVYVLGGTTSADLVAPLSWMGAGEIVQERPTDENPPVFTMLSSGSLSATGSPLNLTRGAELLLSGNGFVRVSEGSGGVATGASTQLPLVSIQHLATGAMTFVPPVESNGLAAFTDATIRVNVSANSMLGPHLIRVGAGGTWSNAQVAVIVDSGSSSGGSGFALGASCTASTQCTSGFCAQGSTGSVCCNAACTGACESCSGTGTCTPRPANDACGPAPTKPCEIQARCSGSSGTCGANSSATRGTICFDAANGSGYCDGSGLACIPGCFINNTPRSLGPNPSNVCEVCSPTMQTITATVWQPAPSTTACDDSNPCTDQDGCNGSGQCTGSVLTGSSCSKDGGNVCNASGACIKGCSIAGAGVVGDGAAKPGNDCQVCDARTPANWTLRPEGSACNDQNPCTEADACVTNQGRCAGANKPSRSFCGATSNENKICSITGQSATCVDACKIDGLYYFAGEQNPGKPCQKCDLARPTEWTNLTEAAEDRCGPNNVCNAGECADGCVIAGQYFGRGPLPGANDCVRCDPSKSVSASTSPALGEYVECGGVTKTLGNGTCGYPDSCSEAASTRTPTLTGRFCSGAVCAATATYDLAAVSCAARTTEGQACTENDGNVCHQGACKPGCLVSGRFVEPGAPLDAANPCRLCAPSAVDQADALDNVRTQGCGVGDGPEGMFCKAGACEAGCQLDDGTFATDGTYRIGGPCEKCVAATKPNGWTATSEPCNDDDPCTDDVCAAGSCQGTKRTGVVEACSATAGDVDHPDTVCNGQSQCVVGCMVGETYYDKDEAEAGNDCRGCVPSTSRTALSNVHEGEACGNAGGHCEAGTCVLPSAGPDAGAGGPSAGTSLEDATGFSCGCGSAGLGAWVLAGLVPLLRRRRERS